MQFNQNAYTIYSNIWWGNSTKHIPFTWSMALNSITGWWGNTPSPQFNQAYTIYMVNGPQCNYRMVGQHPITTIQPSIYHLHGQWPSMQLQDGGATPHHHNSTKHIPFTWSMALNAITRWWGNTPSPQFNQAYTIYMVNGPQCNYKMVGQHPITTIQQSIYHIHGQWPSIQLQDGGATPHHHNSTKHIPFTWSMALNAITRWWGNTPSPRSNKAYTIYMVNDPQFNYRMMGQRPVITIQPRIYHIHGQRPSIQLQDDGSTPHHRNSTKHITPTRSFSTYISSTLLAGTSPAKQTNSEIFISI